MMMSQQWWCRTLLFLVAFEKAAVILVNAEDENPVVTSSSGSNCAGIFIPEQAVAFDDFENYDDSWIDGGVVSDAENYDAFTQFLGPLGSVISYTEKVFTVDPRTDHVVLDFLFYEIDLWCSCDTLLIHLNDEALEFHFTPADDKSQVVQSGGIVSTQESLGPPRVMGFDPRFNDQKHAVHITIPNSYLRDGELKIGFELQVEPIVADMLSGGIDDIRLTAYDICHPTEAPTDSPSQGPTDAPTKSPTKTPSDVPTSSPTPGPTVSPTTSSPTSSPTSLPTASPYPSGLPSLTPTVSTQPSQDPTKSPTVSPTSSPTEGPTIAYKAPPVKISTKAPTRSPTPKPTRSPIRRAPPAPERCLVTAGDDEGRQCYDLKTQDDLPTGELCLEVVDEPEKLQVSYTAGTEFALIKAQFWLGTEPDNVPVQDFNGEPDFEKFPYYWCKSWGMKNWTTKVNLDWEANCLGQSEFTYTMYAHSSAKQITNGTLSSQEEKAYAFETVLDDTTWFNSIDLNFDCDCSEEPPAPPPTVKEFPTTQPPTCVMGDYKITEGDLDGRECYPLVARDGSMTGSVCVELVEEGDETSNIKHVVEVTYEAAEGWALVKNHLWVGQSVGLVPTMLGKLDFHHFPYFFCDFTGMKEWTSRVDFDLSCDSFFSVVAYTTVQKVDASGMVIPGTKQPAYAHEYEGDSGAAQFGWFDVQIGCGCYEEEERCLKEAVVADADHDGIECYPLMTRDDIATGSVCVQMIDYPHPHFEVTYKADPGWALLKNHLWVGEDIEVVPTMVGKLDMHHFPYFYCDYNGIEEWQQRIDHEIVCGQEPEFTYSVVAYTTMQEVDANGTVIPGTKKPAYAFEYSGVHGNNARYGWFDVRIKCLCAQSVPTDAPTFSNLSPPTTTTLPTAEPQTPPPTTSPTTRSPTPAPTKGPTATPSTSPTSSPTVSPTTSTSAPTQTYCFDAWVHFPQNATCFQDLGIDMYGWTNGPMPFSDSSEDDGQVTLPLYSQSDTSSCNHTEDMHMNIGGPVGSLTIDYTGQTKLTKMTFSVAENYFITDTHLYVGDTPFYDLGSGPVYELSDFMFTNENIETRPSTDTHYTRGCAAENYVIGHVRVCGPGPVTQMPSTATAGDDVGISFPVVAASAEPTVAPSILDLELVDLTLQYMVHPSDRVPTEQEIEELICQTHSYATVIFDAYLDDDVTIIAEDLYWSFDPSEQFQVVVDFDIVAHFSNGTKVSRQTVAEILQTSDTEDYIRNFVWQTGDSSHYFYNTNSVQSVMTFVNRKPSPGFTSSFCGNLVVTMPTTGPSSGPTQVPVHQPMLAPSGAPVLPYKVLRSEFNFGFFHGYEREFTPAEFEMLVNATKLFYTHTLSTAYPERFKAFDMTINTHTFDTERASPMNIDFNALVETQEGTDISNGEIYLAMQTADLEDFIFNFLWTFGYDTIFYEVNYMSFNALCENSCDDRRLMRKIRYRARRQ